MTTPSVHTLSLARAMIAAAVLAMAGAPLALPGCETTPTTGDAIGSERAAVAGPRRLEANAAPASAPTLSPAAASADPTASLLDPDAEVDGNVGQSRVSQRARAAAQRPTSEGLAGIDAGGATRRQSAPAGDQKPAWGVLLLTFTDAEHRAMSADARDAIAQRFPELRGVYVHTLGSGSAVLIGRFTGPDDPAAQAELRRVKEVGAGTPKPFARAMLTRLTPANTGPIGPNDLRSVRRARPDGTLYTLQVAAWATLGAKEITMSQVKRSAEAYAQQLRTQGYEAYYFHDFGKETSTVTVGVFSGDVYDSRSTLYIPEVEQLMRKFPKSLVNGEEVLVEINPRQRGSQRVPQSSRLVEIPRF